jgi:hypothetical protein
MFFEEEGKLNNKIKEQGVLFFWGYVWLWIGYDLPQTGQIFGVGKLFGKRLKIPKRL